MHIACVFVKYKFIFAVATALSTDISSTHDVMNISGKEYGYIVSHKAYGFFPYLWKQNNSLTLTDLDFRRVEIVLEHIDVYKNDKGGCADYLVISKSNKICGSAPMSFYVDLSPSINEITFIFKTTSGPLGEGFWLSYKGIYFFLIASTNNMEPKLVYTKP